ncbi:MAG: YhdP family protein [Rhodoferax sp.]|uniref:YhdP family protein n=1 Tax=Rhodoferax sp. TaxID=50421 RepID=UPI0026111B88|nr:YhdP family protein [Rhodoferax sp.]MDD2881569.1 YhdP family protein [Rhodoferax sp.]
MSLLPSKLLKTWSGLTRWLLGMVVLAWLLLGLVWGALHWWIVPRIDQFRPQLEAQASRALGVPVRVGAIVAQSNGMVPSFELTDVTLMDAQGRVALSLPRVLVAISPRSLWRLGFEQVYIDQPKLDVRRLPDGRITVAGLDVTDTGGADFAALDWFFSQIEFVLHGGVVRWTDEQRGLEPVVLQDVKAVVRNRGRHHDMRLDATPPQAWGERLSVRGRFMQPLLSRQNGRWQTWEGQLYAAFERVDLSELRRYVNLGVDVSQGRGALRAWVDVSQGVATGAVADVALAQVNVTLAKDLQPLALQQVQGRVGGRLLAGGFEVTTQNLAFEAADGLRWPGSNVQVLFMRGEGQIPARGELRADKLDLAALAQVVQRIPVEAEVRELLLRYAPKGVGEQLALTWQGPLSAPKSYTAKGKFSQLEWAAVAQAPGVRGLSVDFDLDQKSGRAGVRIDQGAVDLPSVFQDSLVDVAQLTAQARWQLKDERIAVQLSDVSFVNADAQGQAQIKWETSDPAKSASRSRFPGVLDLQATLSRANGTRVHRYLPLVIDQAARDYVKNAITAGGASNVRFAIRGDIDQLPTIDPRQGSFRISADVKDAAMAFVPTALQEPQELPWPTLTGLSGELVIDRMQLHVKDARAKLAEAPAVQVIKANVTIADLNKTTVVVDADFKGLLPDALRVINGSPIGGLIGHALARTVTSGDADIKLKLALPIAQLDKSTVQGSVVLAGNDVHVTPDSPKLFNARGAINFSQTGFTLTGVQARMLGGDARLEGGLVLAPGGDTTRATPTLIRATGTASAEGLRQATELGFVARLARQASGSAAYSATLGFRKGVPELLVQSNLQGMALTLPDPLQKGAVTALSLRLQTELLNGLAQAGGPAMPVSDRLSLSVGQLGSAVYERDVSGETPRVLRGAIGIGLDAQEAVPLLAQGVSASIKLPRFNVDAWQDALSQVAGASLSPAAASVPANVSASSDFSQALAYLPATLAIRADALTFGGRQFNQMVIGGSRDGTLWRANLNATELNGYLEYRQGSDGNTINGAGRVYARLARLTIAPSAESDVEALLDAQPASIPALDIVVDDLELRGKRFGRLEVEAINRMASSSGAAGVREWRLNKFNLSVPEATLVASGNWARLNAQSAAISSPASVERRRTVLNFKLDIVNGGALLARFGMKDVVRRASGNLEGQVAWMGSPLKLDYPTLGGAFSVNVASGQFLKADPGIAKLFGVLSLQSLPRRLTLDFRDVFSDGFAFDFLRGDVTVDHGIAYTNNLQMKGVNAAVLMEGRADIANETQDLKVVVVPEINAGTASLIATVINPAVGLGTFLAQMFLRRPLIESNTQEFRVDGSWTDPHVTKVSRTPTQPKEKTP